MPQLTFGVIIYLLLSSICLILAALYLREYNHSRQKTDSAETKSYQILSQAIKKAQALMSTSELEAIKLTADSKFYKNQLEQKFATELTQAQAEYAKYLNYLKLQTDKSRNESLDAIREQVSNMFSGFQIKLTQFLDETQKNSVQSIDLELKATRQLIETYKSNQLKIIDENVIAMLERTLSLVLVKKLTLKDQIDLVYESLEQAKTEKFIV